MMTANQNSQVARAMSILQDVERTVDELKAVKRLEFGAAADDEAVGLLKASATSMHGIWQNDL